MKEIIYLDTDFLNSFLAQVHDGLPTNINKEEFEEIKDSLESSSGFKSQTSLEATFKTGDFTIPMVLKTPSGEVKGTWRPGKFSEERAIASQTEAAKQIISTQMHDNALEEFIKYLNENELLKTEKGEVGEYIKNVDTFQIIDFEYLLKVFNLKIFETFIFQDYDKQIKDAENQLNSIPKSERSKSGFQQQKLLAETTINKAKVEKDKILEQLKMIPEVLSYLKDILPCSTFLKMEDIIVPLKAEALREKGSELFFKYDNNKKLNITLIGKTTSIIDNINLPNMTQVDALLHTHKFVYVVLESLKLIKNGDKIVAPVAIYFE